jgi:hypothetical protein
MKPLLDAHGVIDHLGDRREAVGGARGVRHHDVVAGELVVVDAKDHREVGAGGGRGDEDPLGACLQVSRGLLLGGEQAGAFQRDIDAQVRPGQVGRIALGGDLDRAGARVDAVAGHLHLAGEAAVHRIEAQQMGVRFHRSQIVDRHDLDVAAAGLDDGAQNVAPDPPKAVDGHPYRHEFTSPFSC